MGGLPRIKWNNFISNPTQRLIGLTRLGSTGHQESTITNSWPEVSISSTERSFCFSFPASTQSHTFPVTLTLTNQNDDAEDDDGGRNEGVAGLRSGGGDLLCSDFVEQSERRIQEEALSLFLFFVFIFVPRRATGTGHSRLSGF